MLVQMRDLKEILRVFYKNNMIIYNKIKNITVKCTSRATKYDFYIIDRRMKHSSV